MGQRSTPRPLRSHPPVLDTAARLKVDYIEAADLTRWLATTGLPPLAIVSFGAPVSSAVSCPVLTVDLPDLDGPPRLEVWTSDQPVIRLQSDDFFATTSGEMLAGILQLEEDPEAGLRRTAEQAYRRLLHRIQEAGFPHLWRIWNYFPNINESEQGLERYRQFSIGRHQALAGHLQGFPGSLPAGTAVGTRSGPLQLYVLAGTHPATHLGNPRQVHAYEYPAHYGPCSPSFARATRLQSDHNTQLFIAGTASVVGHESRHIGQPGQQTKETLNNLRSLLAHATARSESGPRHQLERGNYKVYVRHPEHLGEIQEVLKTSGVASNRMIYLQGDLCRHDLLVEIEGVVTTD